MIHLIFSKSLFLSSHRTHQLKVGDASFQVFCTNQKYGILMLKIIFIFCRNIQNMIFGTIQGIINISNYQRILKDFLFSIKIAQKNKAQLKQFSCTFLLKTNNFIFFLHIDLKMAQKSILIPKCAFLPQNQPFLAQNGPKR